MAIDALVCTSFALPCLGLLGKLPVGNTVPLFKVPQFLRVQGIRSLENYPIWTSALVTMVPHTERQPAQHPTRRPDFSHIAAYLVEPHRNIYVVAKLVIDDKVCILQPGTSWGIETSKHANIVRYVYGLIRLDTHPSCRHSVFLRHQI